MSAYNNQNYTDVWNFYLLRYKQHPVNGYFYLLIIVSNLWVY